MNGCSFSPYRAKRPWLGRVEKLSPVALPTYDLTCYLCPGNKRAGRIFNTHYMHFFGLVPADKGFIDEYRHSLLLERHQITVVTPARKNMQTSLPAYLLRFCKRVRKFVETVGSHLTERFGVDQIRVHDLWHFQHRLIRKVLAHTVCVFLNLMLGRSPLDLDGLVVI
jgi:hypothetical protein